MKINWYVLKIVFQTKNISSLYSLNGKLEIFKDKYQEINKLYNLQLRKSSIEHLKPKEVQILIEEIYEKKDFYTIKQIFNKMTYNQKEVFIIKNYLKNIHLCKYFLKSLKF